MRKHGGTHQEAGFSLLELVVALTLLAMMAIGIWVALDVCIRSWVQGMDSIDINQRSRSAPDLIRKQIASALPVFADSSSVQNMSVIPSLVFSGSESSLRFVSPHSLQVFDSAGLVLVSYEIQVDSDEQMALVEFEELYTGGSGGNGFIGSSLVFINLRSCNFEYYDPGDTEKPGEWVSTWNVPGLPRMPAAIRISMIAKNPQGGTLDRQLVIPLHAQANFLTGNFGRTGGGGLPGGRPPGGRPPGDRPPGDRPPGGGPPGGRPPGGGLPGGRPPGGRPPGGGPIGVGRQ